jgi:tRNA A-37 threonylcarbamoyl transferase component Bud32
MATIDTAPTIGEGRYALLSRLGEGGQAAVYRVQDHRLGVQRALKVLLPRYASEPKIRARFASEARAMARLEHPHVVRVYDVEPDATLPYLVMELLPGGSLADRVRRVGALPAAQAVDVVLQICEGAAAAHAAAIVHRDIKPHNVLIAPDGTCKLTDFGIARMEDGNRTKTGVSMGTRGYMAPEQQRDASAVTERCDVYGIGMTLFVLATALEPEAWVAGDGGEWLPAPLRSVLEAATARDPRDRIPSAEALADALRQVRAKLPAARPTVLLAEAPTTDDRPGFGFPEITPVLDVGQPRRAGTPEAERRPASPGYVMWRPSAVERHAATPDYVDRRSRLPEGGRSSFVIGLDAAEKERSREARRRRAEGDLVPSVEDSAPVVQVPMRRPPPRNEPIPVFRLAAALGVVLLVLAGGAGAVTHAARTSAAEVREARVRLDVAIDADRRLVADMIGLGGDRSALESLYVEWHGAREPARAAVAVRLVDQLEREAEAIEARGHVVSEPTRRELARLAAVRDAYLQVTR